MDFNDGDQPYDVKDYELRVRPVRRFDCCSLPVPRSCPGLLRLPAHQAQQQLNEWLAAIEAFLPGLGARLNPSKTILQPVDRGIDFVGHVIKPWRRTTRKRTVKEAFRRVAATPEDDLLEVANSYFGLFRQASHSQSDRAALANVLLRRGRSINGELTKTYRKPLKEPAA